MNLLLASIMALAVGLVLGGFLGAAVQEQVGARPSFNITSGAAPYVQQPQFTAQQVPALSIVGFSKANISVVAPALLRVTSGCWQIEMTPLESQIYSIDLGLRKQTYARPLTHDLMADIFSTFGIKVNMVKIVDQIEGGTYRARLIVQRGTQIQDLDSRPSDAIGIAVRTGAPVYVNQTLYEQTGRNICTSVTNTTRAPIG